MASTSIRCSDGLVSSKSALERLPTEISDKIYRHLMLSEWGLINIGLYSQQSWFIKEGVLPIHAPLLRTSRHIYQEASAILYEENEFTVLFNNLNGVDFKDFNLFGFPMKNLKRVRKLEICLNMDPGGYCPIAELIGFLNILANRDCCFRQLKFLYRSISGVTPDMDDLKQNFSRNSLLIDAICAIDVQSGISVSFSSRDAVDEVITFYDEHTKQIADRKSWIIEESHRGTWSRPGAENCTKMSKCWILPRPSSAENRRVRLSLEESDAVL